MALIESLEPHTLLSGNVTVKLVGEQLRVTGDSADNNFRFYAPLDTPIAESFYTFAGLDGTTINEQAFVTFTSSNSEPFRFSSLRVNLGDGDDRFELGEYFGGFSLGVDAGAGDDVVHVNRLVDGLSAVDVFAGEGRDTIQIERTTVSGRLRVFPGPGKDKTVLTDVSALRGLEIDDSGSRGRIGLTRVTGYKSSEIVGGSVADALDIHDSLIHTLAVYLKGGNDVVSLTGSTFERDSFISGGPGDDTVDRTGVVGKLDVLD